MHPMTIIELEGWVDLPKKMPRRYGRKSTAEMALTFWSWRTPHKEGWFIKEENGVWIIYPYEKQMEF